jgi:hypothetical protein
VEVVSEGNHPSSDELGAGRSPSRRLSSGSLRLYLADPQVGLGCLDEV